jgi:hypothetical protein
MAGPQPAQQIPMVINNPALPPPPMQNVPEFNLPVEVPDHTYVMGVGWVHHDILKGMHLPQSKRRGMPPDHTKLLRERPRSKLPRARHFVKITGRGAS